MLIASRNEGYFLSVDHPQFVQRGIVKIASNLSGFRVLGLWITAIFSKGPSFQFICLYVYIINSIHYIHKNSVSSNEDNPIILPMFQHQATSQCNLF